MVHPYLRRRQGLETGLLSVEGTGSGAVEDARRAAVPGTGDEDRHRRRRLHAVARPTNCGAPWRPSSASAPSAPSATRWSTACWRNGYRARFRRALLPADRGLRRIWLSGKPRGEFRAAGLCLGLAEVPLSGRLRRRAAERAADGFLRAGADRARRARAWRRGARARRQSFAMGFDAGAGPARRRSPARASIAPCATTFTPRTRSGSACARSRD